MIKHLDDSYQKQIDLIDEILNIKHILKDVKIEIHVAKKSRISLKDGLLMIYLEKQSDLNVLLRILKEQQNTKSFDITLNKTIDTLTYMMDASRNAVAKVSTLKRLIVTLALFGYDAIQLYTEDTFEIEDEPYFGYLRGAYTKAEIKVIDQYAHDLGIELIPCIQTLAHFNQITRHHEYRDMFDINDILLVDDEKTYKLIEKIFQTVKENFSSNQINIGMDEAYMIGRGKYLDQFGYQDKFEIMTKHLNKVLELCRKYDLKPMMWSDMFFALTFNNYYENDQEMPKEVVDKIPKDVSLIYWDYYKTDKNIYDDMLKKHEAFDNPIMFAGGVWKWIGFTPDNRYSLVATKAAMEAVKARGIKDVIVTGWGDNGGEASQFSVLPSLAYYGATKYDHLTIDDQFKHSFYTVTGVNFDDFMMIDSANQLSDNYVDKNASNKHFFYNDILLGLMDTTVIKGYKQIYEAKHQQFKDNKNKFSGYQYIFETQLNLVDVISHKVELGVEFRLAYQQKDIPKMKTLLNDLKALNNKIDIFYESLKYQWMYENKPFGFDVQDLRIGGLKQRITYATDKIEAYLNEEIKVIEELELNLLDYYGKRMDYQKLKDQIEYAYLPIVTVNVYK